MSENWVKVEAFEDEAFAHSVAEYLRGEGIPAKVESLSPVPGLVESIVVLAPASLADRARLVLKSSALSGQELEDAATGKLPGPDEHS